MANTDDSLIQEIQERFQYGTNEWRDDRTEGDTDMRYVAGDPWSPKDRKAREDAGRPCISCDEIGQYLNQVINDVRANKRAIQVTPVGNGANDETAELRANLIRQIEYASHAQASYTTGFENAIQRGFGFWRVTAPFVEDSFNRELKIEPIVNPNLVTIDPNAKTATSADMQWCFVHEWWSKAEFKRRFPKAKAVDFVRELYGDSAQAWFAEDKLQIAEYWYVHYGTPRRLLLVELPNGSQREVFEDELSPGALSQFQLRVLRERKVDKPEIYKCLTNGVEILEEEHWLGRYIPIISCFGKVLYVNDGSGTKRKLLSMVRLARDPAMLHAYYNSTEAEVIGMTPKVPFIGYEGQFRGHEDDFQEAAHQPKAFLQIKALTEATGAQILPLPMRQPYDPPIQAFELGKESARRSIQAAMGSSPLPTSAQRRNEKSGVALRQIESQSQRGTYHFIDHFEDSLRQTGLIINDLLPKIYDSAREVGIRTPDDLVKVVRLNDPSAPEADTGRPVILTDASHDITISTGPSFESEREAASNFADTLAQNPQVFPLIGPLVVKLKNLGPIGDEIAKALEVLQPPQLRRQESQDGAPPVPPEVQQQLQMAQQIIEQARKELAEKDQILNQKLIEERAETERLQMKLAAEAERDAKDNATKLTIAEIQVRAKDRDREDSQRHEVALNAADAAHGERQADRMLETEPAEVES